MSFLNSAGLFGPDIPDSENLQARYDATKLSLSDGESVSTWDDETGNGYDLTAGTAPTFKTSVINGNPVVRFDGVDDFLDVGWSAISQPNWIFVVAQKRSTDDNYLFDSNDGSNRHLLNISTGSYLVGTSSGNFTGSAVDTSAHILGAIFDGASSEFRIDGATDASGDPGGDALSGFTLGDINSGGSPGDWDVGEILIYHSQPTVSEVESFLSDKWEITLS